MRTTWPLTGRAEELDLLDQMLVTDGLGGAVVSGTAGVGKTRLATELLARADQRGWRTLRTSATRSMTTVAFGALIHLLPTEGELISSAVELMQRLRGELARLGQHRRTLLFIDDAHLLDEASAAAAHMLASTGTAFVVATVRSREPVPDAIAALWKDDFAVRIELQPLSQMETNELIEAALGGHVDTVTRNRLWRATRGNVLFLTELVQAGLDRGQLVARGGVWSWMGDIGSGNRLAELIESRLARLTTAQRGILEVLSLGEPLDPEIVADVAGTPLECLEELESSGLVSVTDEDGHTLVRLGHPLYGETLRPAVGLLRRRSIHRALTAAFATADVHRPGDLIRLATWRLDAGGQLDAPTLVAAARQARALFDHRLAERFARAAVAAGGDADAHVLLADALYWQGRHQEAMAVLDETPDDGDRTPDSLAWQAIVTASTLYWGIGDVEAAERALTNTQRAIGPGPQHDELAAHRATIVMFTGRPGEALAVAEPVLTATTASAMTRARALVAMIPALAITGSTTRAEAAAKAGIAIASEVADREPWSLSHFRAGLVTAYWLAGQLDEMHRLAEQAYAEAASRSADDERGMWALLLGRALLAKGRAASALTQLREAVELLRQHDIGGFLSWGLAAQAMAATLLGELTAAGESLAAAEQHHRPTVRTHDTELALARAWLAAAHGETTLASRLVLGAANAAASRGQRLLEAMALHDAVRLGTAGLHRRIAALAATTDGWLGPVYAAHTQALAAADGAGLDHVVTRFVNVGATLHAAEVATQAAQLHHRNGNASAHLAAKSYADALATQCEGATTPILQAAAQQPAVAALTAREREIAGLVARGMSNQDIATRLVLSVRTVGNHLNHIYGKLGISRQDLAPLLNLNSGRHIEN